jgi:heme-degrading monooxygenase HmoA
VHVTITRVSTGDQPIENATIVAEEMYRWLRDMDGFQGFLMLSREGTTLSITFWESSEIADRSAAARGEFRNRIISVVGVEVEEVADYQMMFARLPPLER